jgi:hypothetical protein
MTRLANDLVEAGLKESLGWRQAEEQMRLEEQEVLYRTK